MYIYLWCSLKTYFFQHRWWLQMRPQYHFRQHKIPLFSLFWRLWEEKFIKIRFLFFVEEKIGNIRWFTWRTIGYYNSQWVEIIFERSLPFVCLIWGLGKFFCLSTPADCSGWSCIIIFPCPDNLASIRFYNNKTSTKECVFRKWLHPIVTHSL